MRIGLFSIEQTFIRCRNKDITGLVHIWTQMLKTWIASSQINCSTERTEVCRVPSSSKMKCVAISCWQKEVSVLQWSTPRLINHTPRWSHSPEQLANTREFCFLQWSTSGFINHTQGRSYSQVQLTKTRWILTKSHFLSDNLKWLLISLKHMPVSLILNYKQALTCLSCFLCLQPHP